MRLLPNLHCLIPCLRKQNNHRHITLGSLLDYIINEYLIRGIQSHMVLPPYPTRVGTDHTTSLLEEILTTSLCQDTWFSLIGHITIGFAPMSPDGLRRSAGLN
jgi:hypothetical protein